MGTIGFEKAFKKAVTNFDETKIWFVYKNGEVEVCFVWNGKLNKVPMYKEQYAIDIWKNYFIEFLETGEFDYNSYWILYEDNEIAKEDIGKIYKFRLHKEDGNDFEIHSDEMSNFLDNYRKKYKACGIKQVPKPDKI
jgi:hypothetical protein